MWPPLVNASVRRKINLSITKTEINRIVGQPDAWSLGNRVLYDLCAACPGHTDDSEIVAKVWLIGRAYAASIERARSGGISSEASNDDFYVSVVAPALRRSKLDSHIESVRRLNSADPARVVAALEAHGYLVQLFKRLTNKGKRSLASKYLHFHLPEAFFIYDSRAVTAMRRLAPEPVPVRVPRSADREYAKFVASACGLQRACEKLGIQATPRQIDRILLARFADRSV